jgi:SPP1 gp7 family putative phage head morphogenesis protein
MRMYRYLDSLLANTKKKIRTEFNRVGSMGFDELNVVNTSRVTEAMFDRMLAENDAVYRKAAKKAYRDAGGNESIGAKFVEGVLVAYNLVTGYLYGKEAERKRLRLNEQILTAREYADRDMLRDGLRTSANLWYTQTVQYGVDIVDAATLKAYKDRGIEYVKWVSQDDGKECAECKARNGKVFRITEVPAKSHYGCRCYLKPTEKE